jgi:hypothetical protein
MGLIFFQNFDNDSAENVIYFYFIVTSSSLLVGCKATVLSKSFFVAPIFYTEVSVSKVYTIIQSKIDLRLLRRILGEFLHCQDPRYADQRLFLVGPGKQSCTS